MSRLVSPTQRKALEVLAQGGRIIVVRPNGRDLADTAFLYKKQGEHLPISTATVEVLCRPGLASRHQGPRLFMAGI